MARILVVEDDKELNSTVCLYLDANGHNVVGCFNGIEALASMDKEQFDLIISDIMMPNMDGFSFVEQVRGCGNQVPIIFMTARDDKFSKQLGYRLGVDDYIVKPFDLDELVMKIGAILRRSNIAINQKLEVGHLKLDSIEHTAYLDGEELCGKKEEAINHKGIARTFQNIRLFNNMSVIRNVMVGLHNQPEYKCGPFSSMFRLPKHFSSEKEMKEKAKEILRIFNLEEERNNLACNLPYGKQRKLEIARALATNPKLLLLDEPAAGLDPAGRDDILSQICQYKNRNHR